MNQIVYDWQTIKTVSSVLPGCFRRADVGGVPAMQWLRRVNPSSSENAKNGYYIIIYILLILLHLINGICSLYIK